MNSKAPPLATASTTSPPSGLQAVIPFGRLNVIVIFPERNVMLRVVTPSLQPDLRAMAYTATVFVAAVMVLTWKAPV
ncbi:hypothetical protein [Parabacteroides merdae]|uniref:hypothetical protein n=1 Tax=Parabacteroides merdae TaxID=46503 RepID=UPI00209EBE80|nr:hypothetical protein [Parabacteroides merdae]